MLVPVLIGSGIRTKILTALAQGVPVVTTTIGAEGLLAKDEVDFLIRDEAKSFADAAVALAQNPVRWTQLSLSGQRSVREKYSAEQVRLRRNEIYASLVSNNRGPREYDLPGLEASAQSSS